MASSGDTLGGTAASTATGAPGSDAWSNPNNALVDNASGATCATGAGSTTTWLHITNFNFSSIPDGSTINGITVKARVKCSSTNDWYIHTIRISNSGTLLGTAKGPQGSGPGSDPYNTWSTTASVKTIGGSSDVWGWTPVLATLKSSTFGVQICAEDNSGSSETATIEVVWMDVTYTPAAGGGTNIATSMMMMF